MRLKNVCLIGFLSFTLTQSFAQSTCGVISVMAMEEAVVKIGETPKTTLDDVNKQIKLLKRIIATGNDGEGTTWSKSEIIDCKKQLIETEKFKKQRFK